MSDTSWPCRCAGCADPSDSCDACTADRGEVCDTWCPEHPSHKNPCQTMSLAGRLSALETLWCNVTVGAALCRSFRLGDVDDANVAFGIAQWAPGCGREAPR